MSRRCRSDGIDPNQMQINWSGDSANPSDPSAESLLFPATANLAHSPAVDNVDTVDLPEYLVQHSWWDFKTTFPLPTQEATDAGVVHDEDLTLDGICSIHDEHARERMMLLQDLDAIMDARWRGVDPETGKPIHPSIEEEQEITETLASQLLDMLHQLHVSRPDEPVDRDALKEQYRSQLEKYAEDFGPKAAEQLNAYVHKQHAEMTPSLSNLRSR